MPVERARHLVARDQIADGHVKRHAAVLYQRRVDLRHKDFLEQGHGLLRDRRDAERPVPQRRPEHILVLALMGRRRGRCDVDVRLSHPLGAVLGEELELPVVHLEQEGLQLLERLWIVVLPFLGLAGFFVFHDLFQNPLRAA